MIAGLAAVGAIFGIATSGGALNETVSALFYGFEGSFLALLALAMNLIRMVR